MQTTANPLIEKHSELSSAVAAGNRFFESLQSRFSRDASVEWNLPPTPSKDGSLLLTIKYRPEAEIPAPELQVSTTIQGKEIGDPDEYTWRLEKAWNKMVMKIGDFHLMRARELSAALDEE